MKRVVSVAEVGGGDALLGAPFEQAVVLQPHIASLASLPRVVGTAVAGPLVAAGQWGAVGGAVPVRRRPTEDQPAVVPAHPLGAALSVRYLHHTVWVRHRAQGGAADHLGIDAGRVAEVAGARVGVPRIEQLVEDSIVVETPAAIPPGTTLARRCVREAALARPFTEGTRECHGHNLPCRGTCLVDARVVCAPAAPRLPPPAILVHTHAAVPLWAAGQGEDVGDAATLGSVLTLYMGAVGATLPLRATLLVQLPLEAVPVWPARTLRLDGHDAPRRALPEDTAAHLPFAEHRPQLVVLVRTHSAVVHGAAAFLGGVLAADLVRLGLAGRRGVDDPQRSAGERGAGRRVPGAAHLVVLTPVVHTPAAVPRGAAG